MQPAANGWSSAIAPLPLVVVNTGACSITASLSTAALALPATTSDPTTTTGLWLWPICSRAFLISSDGICGLAFCRWGCFSATIVGASNTSLGISTNAGPPAFAACAMISATASGEEIRAANRVSGRKISSCCGVSCNAPQVLPSIGETTLVPITTTGVLVWKLSSSGATVNRFPGPVEAKTTAILPLLR